MNLLQVSLVNCKEFGWEFYVLHYVIHSYRSCLLNNAVLQIKAGKVAAFK
jgi:hypothetical protein